MKLAHAMRVASQIDPKNLSDGERIAIRVLVEMGKRVLDMRPALRAVVRAVYGEDLNQTELSELLDG